MNSVLIETECLPKKIISNKMSEIEFFKYRKRGVMVNRL